MLSNLMNSSFKPSIEFWLLFFKKQEKQHVSVIMIKASEVLSIRKQIFFFFNK